MIFLPLGDGIYQGERERFYSTVLLLLMKYVRKQIYLLIYLFIVHISNLLNHTLKKEFKGGVLA